MSDTYNQQSIPYRTNDILKITIKYQVKEKQSSKNLVFTKVMFWKVLGCEASQVVENITIQSFLDSFLEKIFNKSFLLLLCKTTRLNSIKIEKEQSSSSHIIMKPLTGYYGLSDGFSNPELAFEFELYVENKKTVNRFFLRGVSNNLDFYDKPNNEDLQKNVTNCEEIFLTKFSCSGLVIQYVIENSFVVASYAKQLKLVSRAKVKDNKNILKLK